MSDSSKNFKILSHANGTHTLVDPENGQAMHSRIGPELEANLVYAGQARIEASFADANAHHFLYDVGMGTAANVIAVLDRLERAPNAKGQVSVYSFETHPEGLAAALASLTAFPTLQRWETPLRQLLQDSKTVLNVGQVLVDWQLRIGDFYAHLGESPAPDTVFFDFYSPKVVPELWSEARFASLREKMGERPARIFTYSASTPVRLHLLGAGFYVGGGISTGVKSETTIAATQLELLDSPLTADWLRKVAVSSSVARPEYEDTKRRILNHSQWIKK